MLDFLIVDFLFDAIIIGFMIGELKPVGEAKASCSILEILFFFLGELFGETRHSIVDFILM